MRLTGTKSVEYEDDDMGREWLLRLEVGVSMLVVIPPRNARGILHCEHGDVHFIQYLRGKHYIHTHRPLYGYSA